VEKRWQSFTFFHGRTLPAVVTDNVIKETSGNFSPHSRVQTASGAHRASYPICTGVLTPGVKQPGREAVHSLPSSAEVENAWSYTSTPQYVFMVWYIIKHWIYLEGVILT
jgi:hypothetical protein